jgi:hypothetical protein
VHIAHNEEGFTMQDVKRTGAHRMRWMFSLLVAFLMLPALVAAPAQAAPSRTSTTSTTLPIALVWVKVQGANGTLFSGPVLTAPHNVTTASGGTHHCDGTNNGANPTPGPTATGALDSAAHLYGFSWDGTYFPSFDDYFVQTIKGETATGNTFWDISVNGQELQVGGCQYQVHTGDFVLFKITSF